MSLKVLTRTRRKRKPISLKFDPEDYELARLKAAKYTGGNLSWWIRYSCTQLEPKPEHLEEIRGEKKSGSTWRGVDDSREIREKG